MRTLVLCSAFASLLAAAAVDPAARAANDAPTIPTPDLRSVRAEIEAKKYDAALAELNVLVVKYQTPDVYSLLGHALWKTGDWRQGMTYYDKALAINPSHKGALEYQGELYIELGQLDLAKQNLAKLKHLCWFGCQEVDDLKAAIEHAP
jgi:tetratricopeptide (TPR) repeat protein